MQKSILQTRVGFLSRKKAISSIRIDTAKGNLLQLLVEHVGRFSFGALTETKGITGDVMLNNKTIEHWNITSFPFANFFGLNDLLAAVDHGDEVENDTLIKTNGSSGRFSNEPIIFDGAFNIEKDTISDTFIDTRGWGKVYSMKD